MSSSALRLVPGGQSEPETDGSLALKRIDHTPTDPVMSLTVERAENGFVLRSCYPEGDQRLMFYPLHMKLQLLEAIENRL
jgi:hypothetical protein